MTTSPFFMVGAACKLKVNEVLLAYATDLSYSIRVNHATPKVLGMYESYTQEPLSYNVSGSFTIVRYARGLKSVMEAEGRNPPSEVSDSGNGIGAWLPGGNSTGKRANQASRGELGYTRADQSLDPGSLYSPMGFTIEVIQKAGNTEGIIARLRNCRIVASDFRITKRGAALQTFTFQACYADEDSFLANESGTGQHIIG